MTKSSLLLVAGVSALLLTGCVTNKKFESTVSDVTTRMDGIQGTIEDQGQRIDKLNQRDDEISNEVQQVSSNVNQVNERTGQALTKAEEAHKLARGKVIWKVTLTNRDLRFGSGKTQITDEGHQVLDDFIERLKALDKMVFLEIQGHTDSTGSEIYNKELGQKRADAVRDYLHEQGVPLNLMQSISYGESKPIAENSSRDGRAQNRRVEILVLE